MEGLFTSGCSHNSVWSASSERRSEELIKFFIKVKFTFHCREMYVLQEQFGILLVSD